jgi:filamentous hemagglutinin family protein
MKKIMINGLAVLIMGVAALLPLACGKNLSPTSSVNVTPTPTNWNITNAVTINAGSYNYGNVHISSTGTLILAGPSGAVTNAAVTLNLSGNFVMDAGSGVLGLGYGKGAGPGVGTAAGIGGGHGGAGGDETGGATPGGGGLANDDSAGPTLMGSGGAGGPGGALFVVIANSASLNGLISVGGESVPANGAGAGGTIFIQANTIFGNGFLEAYGGTVLAILGGGGGGGIITLSVHSGYYFTGTTDVAGGSGSGGSASAGAAGVFTQTGY